MKNKKWETISLCSFGNLINSADRIIMPIAIVAMTDEYKWNLHWQGWILSSFAFGYITSQIIGARAATKHGSKKVLASAVFLWSISTLITPLVASHIYLLISCRILLGLGEGIGLPTIFTIFSESVLAEERSSAFGYLIAAGTIGQTLAALLCPHLYWELSFYFFGSLGFVWVIVWIVVYNEVETNQDDHLPLISNKSRCKQIHWTKFFSHWSFWSIYIAHFAMNWSNYIIMQWLPTYLARYLGANKESISLTAVPYIINSLSGVASGHFADRLISRKWSILSVRRIMTIIGLVGPGIFLVCFYTVKSLLFAVIFVSISMGLCACNSAGHLSNHTDIAGNHAGLSFAISNTIATIPGILCGPLTAELVVQSQGRWFPVFVLAAAVNFVGAIIYASQSTAKPIF